MDLNYALHKIAEAPDPDGPDSDVIEAVEIVLSTIKGLGQQVDTLTKKNDAMERVMYLLVQNVSDEKLRDEMHSTYTKIASGLASPEE